MTAKCEAVACAQPSVLQTSDSMKTKSPTYDLIGHDGMTGVLVNERDNLTGVQNASARARSTEPSYVGCVDMPM